VAREVDAVRTAIEEGNLKEARYRAKRAAETAKEHAKRTHLGRGYVSTVKTYVNQLVDEAKGAEAVRQIERRRFGSDVPLALVATLGPGYTEVLSRIEHWDSPEQSSPDYAVYRGCKVIGYRKTHPGTAT